MLRARSYFPGFFALILFKSIFTKNILMKTPEEKKHDIMVVVITAVSTCLITIFGQQLFHNSNKEFDTKVELKNDLIKEQFEYLNKMLNFSYRYDITTVKTINTIANIVRYKDPNTQKIIKIDTIGYEAGDTTFVTAPSFIISEDRRKIFLTDIDEIKSNKNKVDHEVYANFEELLYFIEKHPLPDLKNEEALNNTEWKEQDLQVKWRELNAELYRSIYNKLN
jgi:hypothetical protein